MANDREMTRDEIIHQNVKLKNIVDMVEKMRAEQKAYFAGVPGSPEKQAALIASKQFEKWVDSEIFDFKSGQEAFF